MTQDEIFEMARRAKLNYLPINETENNKKKLIDFAKLVAQHEREACAKVCEEQMQGKSIWVEGARACSLAIRARGQA
jgi:hypothetical protein